MSLRDSLLTWFDAVRRDLPWRRTRDPYAIWVSEVMLQQTRVETAVRFYERFLARFPTLRELAEASEDDVLAQWSGLGYYRRARLLHRGAREVLAQYGGEVPRDATARRALPGIGRYTAGAIGSIAFDLPEPIVDGNVARVLSRLHRIETPLGDRATDAKLWEEAARIVIGPRPGDLNQALMELGATVCKPTAPRCDACPLANACRGRRDGIADELPRRKARKAPTEVWLAAVVPLSRQEVWLRRQDGALFGGLWGVPCVEVEPVGPPQLSLLEARGAEPKRADAQRALGEASLRGRLGARPVGRVTHVLTHRRMEVTVWRATQVRGSESEALRVHPLDALHELGVARLTRKILDVAVRR